MTGAGSTFHVDLRGVVDLLSHHLYSSPRVYLRELLQNSVDAITARCEEEPDAPRRVRVVPADLSPDGCLHVEDTGIGLDEDGIRGVLATIGASTTFCGDAACSRTASNTAGVVVEHMTTTASGRNPARMPSGPA